MVIKVSNRDILITLIVILILETLLVVRSWKPPITLFPYRDVKVTAFSDTSEVGGNSSIHVNHAKKELAVTYILQQGFAWPFAGIQIQPTQPLDLRAYDFLEVSMTAQKNQHAMFSFWTAPVVISGDTTSERPHFYGVNVVSSKETYKIPFTSFITTQWWLAEHNVELSQLPTKFMRQVLSFDVRSGYEEITGEQRFLTIKQIKITKNHTELYLRMLLLFFGGIVVLSMKEFLHNMSRKKLIVPLKDIVITPGSKNPIGKIISVIGEHCDDPELTLYKVAQLSEITELKVSQTIKKEFGLNFKQYLNRLRMEIATTLLKDSDLSIKEITFKSGYKTNAHFFRVFRSFYDESPTEYRKRVSQKS